MTEAERFSQALIRCFSPFRELTSAQINRLYLHYSTLVRWNKVLNLTSVSDLEEAVVRHYCESLFIAADLPPGPLSVVDIGSGAGFPGIPIAVMRPDLALTLVESHQRKAVFLRESSRDMSNVRIAPERAESIQGEFDWVVSRAVRFEEVLTAAQRIGRHVALLLGQEDAARARAVPGIGWEDPRRLPWGKRRVLLVGQLSST